MSLLIHNLVQVLIGSVALAMVHMELLHRKFSLL